MVEKISTTKSPKKTDDETHETGSKSSNLLSIVGIIVLVASIYYYYSQIPESTSSEMADESWKNAKSIYEFSFKDIDGAEQSMTKYKGHVLIIVNVASECGFTKTNYEQLGQLYEKYGETKGLRILGFPCNQFKGQEPLDESQIKSTTCSKFKVTFDMTSKINVNGDDADPLWKYLKHKQGGTLGSFIKWNFTKFLIDKDGQVVKRYGPQVNPNDMEKDLLQYF